MSVNNGILNFNYFEQYLDCLWAQIKKLKSDNWQVGIKASNKVKRDTTVQRECACQKYNFSVFALKLNFFFFRYAKINEFFALSKNQSYLCFILAGELFGAFRN